MTSGKSLSRARIKKAIPKSGGVISAICAKTGYTWEATNNFIKNDPELLQLVNDEEARMDDQAEQTIKRDLQNVDTAKWWLTRRRRAKFGDAIDVNVKEKIDVVFYWPEDAQND